MLVVEAILVAILVLTAVLFFTSVQRPTAGAESQGVDLGQVATDTLGILQRRAFTSPAVKGDPEDWVTKVLGGDTAAASTVDDFVTQVLPTGAKHVVRLSNGVGTVGLLPTASPGLPRGARAAEIPLFPHWQAFAGQVVADVGSPGQGLTAAANPTLARFTDPTDIRCIKAPYSLTATATSLWQTATALTGTLTSGSATVTGLSSTAALEAGMRAQGTNIPAGTTVSAVASSTSVTLSAAATGSGSTSVSFIPERVPKGAVYGTWAGYTDVGCSAGAVYAAVVLPGARVVPSLTWTTATRTLTAASATFSSSDIGTLVVGTGMAGGAVITAYNSTTAVTLSVKPTAAGTATSLVFAPNPTYPVYGLQLVVWFGA